MAVREVVLDKMKFEQCPKGGEGIGYIVRGNAFRTGKEAMQTL